MSKRIYRNYKLPPSYDLGSKGVASFLEPPNHPRHEVQSIYTRVGAFPYRGAQYYHKGTGYTQLEDIDKLYKPLPLNHPATQKWIRSVYAYFKDTYSPDGKDRRVSSSITVEPKETAFTKYSPDKFTTKPQPPEHHLAHLLIKKYYPQAKPRRDLIGKPPSWGKTEYPRTVVKKPRGLRYV